MKISFNVLSRVCIDVVMRRDASGTWVVRGVFPTFPERPGHPHLSLFTEPREGILTPHFTANRGNSREFRSTLAKVRVEDLAAFSERVQPEIMRAYAAGLTPTDLCTLTDERWTVHGVNPHAVVRWMKRHCKPGAVLELNEDFAVSFAWHVFQHWVRPRDLAEMDGWHAFPILRLRPDEQPEVGTLFKFPKGVWVPDAEREIRQIHPPGWYVLQLDWMKDEVLEKSLPVEQLKRIAKRLEQYLARYPRRMPAPDHEVLPRFIGHVVGFYGDDLLKTALALAIKTAEGSSPDPGSREGDGAAA